MPAKPPSEALASPSGPAPLTTASRQRLQKVFEHAGRAIDKRDHDYANQLLTQCVVEDPANLIYLQHFFGNLQEKYGDAKRGSKLSGLKIKGHRSTLSKAAAQGDWPTVFQAGCAALALNPTDIPTLLALANAAEQLRAGECQLLFLHRALHADPHHQEANRRAAAALQQIGQFDQAIACWQRIVQVKPADDEAHRAISRLSVEKTILEGGYDNDEKTTVVDLSKDAPARAADAQDERSPEDKLKAEIAEQPGEADGYLQLSERLMHEQRFDEAEQWLTRGQQAVGSGDLAICQQLEEVQLRRSAHQLAVALQLAEQDPSEANQQLATQLRSQANQIELEVYASRCQRDPQNARLCLELGIRLKRAGKPKEAIPPLQTARSDPSRRVEVLVHLGECFQRVEQYKLALSHYEQAVEAQEEPDGEIRRLALYRAGVLATGMEEWDRAERHLSALAGLDYGYRDVAERLDNLNKLRDSG